MSSPAAAVEERLDLIDAVVYADLFDCAVTLDEVWRFGRRPVGRDELRERLETDPALRTVVGSRDGLYFLAGREALLELRRPRQRRARELQRRARAVACVLQHGPFVRGLMLTGSAAADNADESADVDLLVIVAEGRLSLAFALLGPLSRVLSPKVFCPNHYVSEGRLRLARRNLYVARELVQARALAGAAEALRAENGWVDALLPNAAPRPAVVRPLPGGAAVQRLLEWPLRGRLGDALERRARRLALSRLAAHHEGFGAGVPREVVEELEADVELRFHGSPAHDSVVARYKARRSEVARSLRRALA